MIHDIYSVQQEIRLLEDSILLNRFSKSAITRLVGVEVGDMAKPDVAKLLRRTKSSLENKMSITKGEGLSSYSAASQIDNVIVHATRNGQGSISAESIGGDVDVKSLLDLDYFNDKRFGGLKIPKPFLGFEESLGSNSGGTLTKMDARYGRTIKRLQSSIMSGVTDLVNMYLIARGREEDVNNFSIKMVSPTTVEDLDRDEVRTNKLNLISNIFQLIGGIEGINQKELMSILVDNYLNDPDISELLGNIVKDKPDLTPDDIAKSLNDLTKGINPESRGAMNGK